MLVFPNSVSSARDSVSSATPAKVAESKLINNFPGRHQPMLVLPLSFEFVHFLKKAAIHGAYLKNVALKK